MSFKAPIRSDTSSLAAKRLAEGLRCSNFHSPEFRRKPWLWRQKLPEAIHDRCKLAQRQEGTPGCYHIEAALPTLVQYVNDQFQSTSFVPQFEVVPDAFSTCAAEVIFQ